MIPIFFSLLLAGIHPVQDGTPNRQPQLAVSGSTVALVFGSGRSVMFASSSDGGETFSQPAAVAQLPVLALAAIAGRAWSSAAGRYWSAPSAAHSGYRRTRAQLALRWRSAGVALYR